VGRQQALIAEARRRTRRRRRAYAAVSLALAAAGGGVYYWIGDESTRDRATSATAPAARAVTCEIRGRTRVSRLPFASRTESQTSTGRRGHKIVTLSLMAAQHDRTAPVRVTCRTPGA
jgi:hypothetical protein